MSLLVAFAVVLIIAVGISAIAKRTIVSTTVMFLVAGFVLGDGVTDLVHLTPDDALVNTISEIALFTVLFTDGQQIGIRELRHAWRLPGRALLLGLPLTLGITAVLGVWLLGLDWASALLVAAVLAPTDPVFAAAIVGREEIPQRTRSLLNVESGLNDGLALPLVLVFLAVAAGEHADVGVLAVELLLGVVLGVAVPVAVRLLFALPFFRATPLYATLTPVAVGLLTFGLAQMLDANLYLAAFTCGITIASIAPQTRDTFREFGELLSEVVKLLAILVFGALISPSLLTDVNLSGYVFAILLLVVARPLAVEIALARSGLDRWERLTAAWFGPKGFASVLYGLLVLGSDVPDADRLFHIIVVAVVLSIIAHSSTDVPIADAFARRAEPDTDRASAPGH
ncbi:cation:proton antiporter [Curtobacterium sp. MCSS17_016]|uniref:cation:proton antiporter n=1 Tax=Curtobacterium sp. MCSS17_016 TaxID=2175644 RepID=UPI000DA86DD8|nr:cation:proton antiporter [Curtobacterium sp. MCSS17_016]WIE80553.1 cation:proton antiporter [Curtobacterium sp. MCSS17_016]